MLYAYSLQCLTKSSRTICLQNLEEITNTLKKTGDIYLSVENSTNSMGYEPCKKEDGNRGQSQKNIIFVFRLCDDQKIYSAK